MKTFFELCKSEARKSKHRFRLGAVIHVHGKPLSCGHNQIKTHPEHTANSFRNSIHAEIDALLSACTDVSGGVISIVRIRKNGLLAMAKPCSHCKFHLRKAGIRTIIYSINDTTFAVERL